MLGDEVSLLSNPDEPQRRLLGVGRVRREVAEAEREGRGLALEHRLQRELDAAADRAVADDQARERGVLEDRPGARRSRGDAAEDRNVDRVADGGPPPGPDGGARAVALEYRPVAEDVLMEPRGGGRRERARGGGEA